MTGRRVRRRAQAAIAAAALAVLLLPGAATAAPAPPDAVELSVDGQTWSTDLVAPLFDPAMLWVPGDVETASLQVRTACDDASAQATVAFVDADPELDAELAVRTRVDGGGWTPGRLGAAFPLVGGAPATLDVEVAFDFDAGNRTQARTAGPVTVTVAVECLDPDLTPSPGTQPPPRSVSAAGAPPTGAGHLPRTGVEVAQALTAGALLVVVGGWLVLAARRRGADDA